MAEPVGEDRHVKFVFHRAADYRVVAANCVWGGITPRGDILVEFMVESAANPETVTNLVRSDGGARRGTFENAKRKTFRPRASSWSDLVRQSCGEHRALACKQGC